MNQKYMQIKNKYYNDEEKVFKIIFSGRKLVYDDGLCELAEILNYFRKPMNDIRSYRSNPEKFYKMFTEPVMMLGIFTNNLADMAGFIMGEKGIYDINKQDFLISEGGLQSAFRTSKKKSNHHNNIIKELEWAYKWGEEAKKIKDLKDNDKKISQMAQMLNDIDSHMIKIVLNVEEDVLGILDIDNVYEENFSRAMSIVKNLIEGKINDEKAMDAIGVALQLYPFRNELYDEAYKIVGSKYEPLNDLKCLMMMDEYIIDIDFFEKDYVPPNERGTDASTHTTHDSSPKSNKNQSEKKEKGYKWSDVIRLLPEKFSMQAVYYIRDGNEKTDRKMVAAMEAYANSMEKDELPLGVYDDTLMGACDEGVLFTTLGVRIHTSYQDGDEGVFIPYEDIETVEVRKGFLIDNVYINDEQVSSSMMGDDKKTFCNVISFLCQVIPKVGPVPPKQSQSTNHQLSHSEQNSSQKRFCPNCGKKIEHEGKFCSYCGTKIR